MEGPRTVRNEGELLSVLTALDHPTRELLHALCAWVHWPHHEDPSPLLVPYSLALQDVVWHDGDEEYTRLVDVAHAALDAADQLGGWGEFGWGLLQRLCRCLASGGDEALQADLLLPVRLALSVPPEWRPAVRDALENLGPERALLLPSLA